jgi:hypothetical protein
MKGFLNSSLARLVSSCALTIAASFPALAADSDPVARFIGHYRSGPGFPALAVERMPVELFVERGDGDIVIRFFDAYQAKIITEMVYADSPSPFHLLEHTAASDIAMQSGFFRATGDLALAQRSEIGSDGQQRHLRLLLHRSGNDMNLVVLTSDGTGALVAVSKTLLRLIPEQPR